MKRGIAVVSLVALATLLTSAVAPAAQERPDSSVALDARRHPVEVLGFLELKEGMTVLDVPADGGYYSEVMARTVGPEGRVIALVPEGLLSDFAALQARNPNVELRTAVLHEVSPDTVGADEADFVLLHVMYHDTYWDEPGASAVDPARFVRALYRTLRPGGVVGVIDFVGEPGDTRAIVNRLHRIDPRTVRADFEQAGFVFEGASDLLRNPADDHTLSAVVPPMRGNADQFVLRFRKPVR